MEWIVHLQVLPGRFMHVQVIHLYRAAKHPTDYIMGKGFADCYRYSHYNYNHNN